MGKRLSRGAGGPQVPRGGRGLQSSLWAPGVGLPVSASPCCGSAAGTGLRVNAEAEPGQELTESRDPTTQNQARGHQR